jgi:DNA-binding response OmpR family regulator
MHEGPMDRPLILLVDSDQDTRAILRKYLEYNRYRILDCGDGETGIALAREHKPDLVIGDFPLDVPGYSPFSEALRSDSGSDAPILVFTARGFAEQVHAARAVGDAVVVKPAMPDEVLNEVQRLLGRRAEIAGHHQR